MFKMICKTVVSGDEIVETWCKKDTITGKKVKHRDDGPAQIRKHISGYVISEGWYKNGIYDRNDGPSFISYYPTGIKQSEMWGKSEDHFYLDDVITAERSIHYNQNGTVMSEIDISDRYNEDGMLLPFHITYDNTGNVCFKSWVKNGVDCSKEFFPVSIILPSETTWSLDEKLNEEIKSWLKENNIELDSTDFFIVHDRDRMLFKLKFGDKNAR